MTRVLPLVLLAAFTSACSSPLEQEDPEGGRLPLTFSRVTEDRSYGDVAFSADGRIVAIGTGGIEMSEDDGAQWRPCVRFTVSPRAVAFRPDGERILIGSTFGDYALLSGDCRTELQTNVVRDRQGDPIRYNVNALLWHETSAGAYEVVAALGAPNLGGGALARTPFEDAATGWEALVPNPVASGGNAPVSAFYSLATRRDRVLSGVYETDAQGMTTAHLLRSSGSLSGAWVRRSLPFGEEREVPVTISTGGRTSDPILYHLRDDTVVGAESRLYVERSTGGWALVDVAGLSVGARVFHARFDGSGRVWLATSRGLYRSAEAVDA